MDSLLFAIKQSVKRLEYCAQVLAADFWIDTVLVDNQHNRGAGMIDQSAHSWSEQESKSLARL